MPIQWRGLAPDKEKGWKFNIQREDKLRLEWFRKNEQRLNEIAYKSPEKMVPQDVKDSFEKNMVESFKHHTFMPRVKTGEPDPIDPRALHDIMRPVDPNLTKLIYRKEVDGRNEYLKKRVELLPEKRFYLPENSNAIYGWKMFNHKATKYGFGRWFIIKHSFYRRQGVARDPDWYREPAVYSPSICTP